MTLRTERTFRRRKRMRRYIAAVLAAVLCVALMAGCKSMPDEMADAVKLFTEQVDRITSQTAEAGELVAQAEELIASKKPVADSSTITKLQSVVNDVKENVINFELPKRPASLNAITEKVNELKEIDFTSYLDKLKEAIQGVLKSQKEYELKGTEVTKVDGTWGLYKDGTLVDSYTGVATNDYGTWFIKSGEVDFDFTGNFVTDDGQSYNIVNGKVQ